MIDFVYNQLVKYILAEGEEKEDRTGIGTLSVFHYQIKYDMSFGTRKLPEFAFKDLYPRFPLLTGKKINFNNVMHELNWFLRGETNIKTLKAPQIWKPWANPETGDCYKIYGHQWITWEKVREPECDCDLCDSEVFTEYINQIENLISNLKYNPTDRGHLVSAWNVADLEDMALRPCHWAFECYISNKDTLNLKWHQRSVDVAVGLPYNIASYALLLKMLAKECGYKEGYLIGDLTNVHIYKNHIESIKEQITRPFNSGPELTLNLEKTFWQLVKEDDPKNYMLNNYNPHPFIKYEVAV